MLLGAPSVYYWRGTTVTYGDGSDFVGGLAKRRKNSPANAFNQGPFIRPTPDEYKSANITQYGLFG